jgi:hypothetical protein
MSDRHTCVACGKKSPATNTDYTLISAQFGWRLARTRMPNGHVLMEWRCPDCWREHKKSRDQSGAHRPPLPSFSGNVDTESSNVFRSPLGSETRPKDEAERATPAPPVVHRKSTFPKR